MAVAAVDWAAAACTWRCHLPWAFQCRCIDRTQRNASATASRRTMNHAHCIRGSTLLGMELAQSEPLRFLQFQNCERTTHASGELLGALQGTLNSLLWLRLIAVRLE